MKLLLLIALLHVSAPPIVCVPDFRCTAFRSICIVATQVIDVMSLDKPELWFLHVKIRLSTGV